MLLLFSLIVRSSIDDNSIIKPDMTPQNQHKEALLLKEWWALIKSGVDKVDIKINSSSLCKRTQSMATYSIRFLIVHLTLPQFSQWIQTQQIKILYRLLTPQTCSLTPKLPLKQSSRID